MKIYSRLRSKPKKKRIKVMNWYFAMELFSLLRSIVPRYSQKPRYYKNRRKKQKKPTPPRTETYAKQLQTRINSRENKSVPVDPVGVLGIELHELIEKDMRDWGHSHRRTGMARVRIRDRISLSNR